MSSIYSYVYEDILNEYVSRTKRSREIYEEAIKHTPGGVQSSYRHFLPYPFYIKKAKGSKIWDVDNNEYIDYVMGYGPNIAGHAHPILIGALEKQFENGFLYTMPFELQIKLIRELKHRYPMMNGFRLSNTGSEAVMHSIKLARAFTNRDKIIKIEGSYHGTYDAVAVSMASKPEEWGDEEKPRSILGSGVLKHYENDTIVIQYNDLNSLEFVLKKYEGEIAAMIIEPVAMNSVGVILPERKYLEEVRKLTQEHNVILIFDEVKTGLRISSGGATQYFKIDPDIVVLAKALGGGIPIAAFGFKKELMDIMYPNGKHTHSGTYNGNPLSVATAYANLTKILTENAYYKLHIQGEKLAKGIIDVITDLKMPLCISYIESVGAIHFMPRKPRNYRDVVLNYDFISYANYWMMMILRGVIIRGVIEGEPWFLSLAHTDEDIEKTIEDTDIVLREIKARSKTFLS